MTRPRASLACFVLVAGCQPTLPRYSVHVPPRLLDIRPAPSVVFARAQVPLDGMRRVLEDALPPRLDGEASRGAVSAKWALARQPAVVEGVPGGIRAACAMVGPVELRAGPLACRAPAGGFQLGAVGRPALTESGALKLADLSVTARPTGELACAGIRLPSDALLKQAAAPFERVVALGLGALELPLGPILDQGLDALAAPRPLTLAGEAACLELAPSQIVLAPVSGEAGLATLKVGFEVAPRVVVGACPAASPRPRAAQRVREAALVERFAVEVALAVPADELAARVRPALVGRSFGDERRVIVRALELGDASGRLLARIEVTGALTGAIYLWGTPQIVERGGRYSIEVPDLQVAAETRSLVTRVALWLWQLQDGGLEAAVRKLLAIDVTDRLAAARAALNTTFRPGGPLALALTIDRIEPAEVESRPGVIVVHARLIGSAELRPAD